MQASTRTGVIRNKLSDGSKVSVKTEYRATLPKDDFKRKKLINGFEEQGLADIIKNNVSVSFGAGEENKRRIN